VIESPVRILLVDESRSVITTSIERFTRDQRVFEVISVSTRHEFSNHLAKKNIDLVLTDTNAFGLNNQQILSLIQEYESQPIIIFTASGAKASTLEVMKHGAADMVFESSAMTGSIHRTGTDSISTAPTFDSHHDIPRKDEIDLASKAFEHTAEGIFITNARADIISINKAFTEITGFSPTEVLGEKTHLFQSETRDQDFFENMWESLEVTGRWQGEIWNRNKEGEIYPEWLTITTVKNEKNEVTNYIGVFTDITARKQSEERLRFLATHDPLTDLPNRDLFNDRLNHTLARARRNRQEAAVLLLDLDQFKNINDTCGHSIGDRLLQIVATRLKKCLRKSDTVARMGGDEFTFILEEIPTRQVCKVVAQKILQTISEPYQINDHNLTITVSVGISIFPDHGHDPDTLIKNADIAMYQAKSTRNSYCFYQPELTHKSDIKVP